MLRHACSAVLLVYTARRLLFVVASARRKAPLPAPALLPSLAIVVPCRDEAPSVGHLLEALERATYPDELLAVVVVDDGSSDGTGDVLRRWAAAGASRFVVGLPASVGKVEALRAGVAAAPDTELVAVCDADLRPRPEAWERLAETFSDDRVGAAAAFLNPANHAASVVSRYAAVETWVHQLVTSQGKDTLRLNPPTHGASMYRRSALADLGGFVAGVSGEDVTTTVALTEAGWTTRFVPDAVVDNQVVASWEDYWHQHVRWARGVFDTTSERRRRSRASLPRRIEAWLLAAGYLDRLAFVGTLVLSRRGFRGRGLAALYTAVAGVEVWVALTRGGVQGARRLLYLGSLPVVFPVDIAATVVAVAAHVRQTGNAWRSPR